MDSIPLTYLFILLAVLIVVSGFFSSSETGLMTLNRYRLRHRAKQGHRASRIAIRLLDRPDRLLGVILLGNNAANILASAVATVIWIRIYSESTVLGATVLLTFVILIFAEVAPKTFAALHPERIAMPAAYVFFPLLYIAYPIVAGVNLIANGMLRVIRVYPRAGGSDNLSLEELRSVVMEAGVMIPRRHQRMLVRLLDLERSTVEDIMVPRNEIKGIDLEDSWEDIQHTIISSEHTRLPVFNGSIDELHGMLHLRSVLGVIANGELEASKLREMASAPYFIPEGTELNQQLVNFQKQQRRIGFVVDEYGDIQGLATLEDILEEVVGEFTTDPANRLKHIHPENGGTYLVDGSINIRSLNRTMNWQLPTNEAKTLNGMIVERLENIPETGARLDIDDYSMEITETAANTVRSVRIHPPAKRRKKPRKDRKKVDSGY